MYLCESCGTLHGPRVPQFKRITKTRDKLYVKDDESLVRGSEIVEEIAVCPGCHRKEETVNAKAL
uniref:Uncharacterized protein n=1 Tax=viral metagenome TaxID=1070528 RepID=A0A6M3X6A5_9ZZZZ